MITVFIITFIINLILFIAIPIPIKNGDDMTIFFLLLYIMCVRRFFIFFLNPRDRLY
jgi:hypothetical protein